MIKFSTGWVCFVLLTFLGGIVVMGWGFHPAAGMAAASPGRSFWGDWEDDNFIPGASDQVNKVLEVGAHLYAGGTFTYVDGMLVNQIARWDLSSGGWQALGAGLTQGNSFGAVVYDMAADSSGNVYIVGAFDAVDGVSAKSIAVWDGSAWSGLGDGIPDGQIYAIVIDSNDNVVVGGDFSLAGSTPVHNIAMWNAASAGWSALGEGFNASVFDLVIDPLSGNLMAGGTFTETAGDTPVILNYIALWETSAWRGFGSDPNIGSDGPIFTLALIFSDDGSESAALVGGLFSRFLDISASNCAIFQEGVSVSAVCDTNGPVLAFDSITIDDMPLLIMGGQFTQVQTIPVHNLAVYSPVSDWVDVYANKPVYTVSFLSSETGSFSIAIGGAFNRVGDNPSTALAENFIAVSSVTTPDWLPLTTLGPYYGAGFNGLVHDMAMDGDRQVFVGDFTARGMAPAFNIFETTGTISPGDGTDGPVYAAAFAEDGDLFIGGDFSSVEGVNAQYLAYWDAVTQTWHPVGTEALNGPVHEITLDGDMVYIGGEFTLIGSSTFNLIAGWDRSPGSWFHLADDLNGEMTAEGLCVDVILVDGGNVIAGGSFTHSGLSSVPFLGLYDGINDWVPLGGGVDAPVLSLGLDSLGNLYAGGIFNTAGSTPAQHLAVWDGTGWSSLATGLAGPAATSVTALAIDDQDHLVISGAFTSVNGQNASYIAHFDGEKWSPIGLGLSNAAQVILFQENETLLVGGNFQSAGGYPSSNWGAFTFLPGFDIYFPFIDR